MEHIEHELFGQQYRIIHPKGEAALHLYTLAMSVCAGDVLDHLGAGTVKDLGNAALKLAGVKGARDVVAKTLVGATVDGEQLKGNFMVDRYAQPGEFVKPYMVALIAWGEMGFFSVTGASKPSRSVGQEDQHGRG